MPRKREPIEWAQSVSKLPAIQELTRVANHDPLDMCGPTAISAITGVPLRDVYAAIIRSRGIDPERPQRIYGMATGEVVSVCAMLGYRADVFDIEPKPGRRATVRKFFIDRGDDQAACIIVTKTHFVAADWGIVIDNHTNGLEATIDELGFRNHSVINYIEVRKLDQAEPS